MSHGRSESNHRPDRPSTEATREQPAFEPVQVAIVDVARPIPGLPVEPPDGQTYTRAVTYVRWDTTLIGVARSEIPAGGLSAAEHAASIWQQLSPQLIDHAAARGAAITDLPAGGLGEAAAAPEADPAQPHITVVIATRDRPELLDRCLQSLLAVDYPSFDVVIVDNAPSSDATAELIGDRYPHEHIRRIREDRPGLAAAHNRGLREAKGEILAFTDDDVIVDEHWLTGIAAAFGSASRVGCVTGMIVPLKLDTQAQWWLEGYAGFSKGFARRTYNLGSARPDDSLFPYAAGKFGSGANMAFRKSVLEEIGGFDIALGAGSGAYGGDDLAAFFDVVSHGHTLVYEPAAIVRHEHPDSVAKLRRQVFGYGAGLTAYLTHTMLDRPSRFFTLAAKAPRAVWYATSQRSDRNARQPDDYPGSLRWREFAGMAVGPVAYVRTRIRRRKANWHEAPSGAASPP